jgi:peroxiredoxin Q/BCP
MAPLPTGRPAPDFTLPDERGGSFTLSQERGHPVVLEFYCEDDSGGCIIENQEFSDLLPEFEKIGVPVVGISPQDVASHRKFAAKYGFKQPLLADPHRTAIEAYGLWEQKKLPAHQGPCPKGSGRRPGPGEAAPLRSR